MDWDWSWDEPDWRSLQLPQEHQRLAGTSFGMEISDEGARSRSSRLSRFWHGTRSAKTFSRYIHLRLACVLLLTSPKKRRVCWQTGPPEMEGILCDCRSSFKATKPLTSSVDPGMFSFFEFVKQRSSPRRRLAVYRLRDSCLSLKRRSRARTTDF